METPEVAPFPYDPLDTSRSMIRLLKFSISEGQILASFQHWSLDSSDIPSFNTVSYTWGPLFYSKTIELHGHRFPVLDQLYPFLSLICEGRDRDLVASWWWIDSICINQRDDIERSQQVQLMRRVYREATRTMVWLGDQSRSSAEAIEFLHSLCEHARSQQMTEQDIGRLRGPGFKNKWAAVEDLLQRPWWKRVWTLQEFIVPQSLVFFCGHHTFSRNTLRDMLVAIWICEHTGRASDLTLLSYYSAWNRRRLLEWFLFRNENVADERSSLRLIAIMAYLGDCEATDPRDRIYSVLGLADDYAMVGQPDYERDVKDVYTSLITSFIDLHKSLDVICFAHIFYRQVRECSTELNLPSWVPDWTVKARPEVVPLLVSQSAGCHISNFRPHHSLTWTAAYTACGEHLPCVEILNDRSTLKCSGILVDIIDGLGRQMDDFAYCAISSTNHFVHATSPVNLRQYSEMAASTTGDKTSSSCELPNMNSVKSAAGSPTLSNGDLSDTGLSDYDISPLEIEMAELDLAEAEYAKPSLEIIGADLEELVEAISQSLVLGRTDKYLRHAASVAEDRAAFLDFCHAVQEGDVGVNPHFRQWYNHNKFLAIGGRTIENLTARVPSRDSTSDRLDLADGTEPTSFLARFHNSTRTLERRIAVTAQGHVGMAPLRARKNDLVCVLYGCSVPVVLRTREDGVSYEFVGEMYLHGFMNGEAIGEVHQGKLEIEKFALR